MTMVSLWRSYILLRHSRLAGDRVTRPCIASLSCKSAHCVVVLSPQSSRYHTKTRLKGKTLLRQDISHFASRPIHRNNSFFSSILNQAFVVRAAEPLPDDITETSPPISTEGSVVLEDRTVFESPSVIEASVESSVTSEAITGSAIIEDKSVFESSSVIEESVESTLTSEATIESITYIPPPPAPPEVISQPLNALGEPTLQSLGLGGWTPVGMLQNFLDFLHTSLDIPWWCAIAVATVCIRTLLFPLVIKAQKNAAKMNHNLPQLQILQMKISEARNSGNQMETARLSQEMLLFMKKNGISPMKNMMVPLAQAPIFMSMFLGLRGMANLPMESMKDGGMFWFADLTVCDPYYILPMVTCVTMLVTIELGTDGPSMNNSVMQNAKWVLRGLPLLVFPFSINFPTAVLCYWVSTNLFSLVQVGVLRIPTIREYLNIPKLIVHKPETLPQKQKGVVAGFKEYFSNMKVAQEIDERERYDEMRFKKAGSGPVVRTFKHDPTKKRIINVQAKVKSKH